ncbi:MAG: hypothetical protein JOZ24_07810 [Candidatus Eremiobacteraeota bacterium]|nr:hypothetical protein [Candidatus Eremiobacteraeota bacterium]
MSEEVVVAAFARRHAAVAAAADLRGTGFMQVWLGACVDEGGVERLQALDPMERAARWIRAAGDENMRDALLARGVSERDVTRLERVIPEGDAVLIARGPASAANAAAEVITAHGGMLYELTGRSGP